MLPASEMAAEEADATAALLVAAAAAAVEMEVNTAHCNGCASGSSLCSECMATKKSGRICRLSLTDVDTIASEITGVARGGGVMAQVMLAWAAV